jgi:hypothetical protein
MRRLLRALCFVALVLPGVARASEGVLFDDQWWGSATVSTRASYIGGVTDGIITMEDKLGVQTVREFSHTLGYYADKVSNFYAAYADARSAIAADIIYCYGDGISTRECLSNLRSRSHPLQP